jgi:hypothetical protein
LITAQERERRHERVDVLVTPGGYLHQSIDDDRRGFAIATNDQQVRENSRPVLLTGRQTVDDVAQPVDGVVEMTKGEAGLREEDLQRRAHRRRSDWREQRLDAIEGAMGHRLDGVVDDL